MIDELKSILDGAAEPPSQGRVGRDTLPPSTSRPTVVEPDETAGLVSVLYHAQQSALQATRFANEAREAHDEELALFLEDSLRECESRIARAKRVLAARLSHVSPASSVTARQPYDAPQGRVHYVSVPDEAGSAKNVR
ncbi:MAG TPA: hypothetical protein VGL19_03780 [Polyangiaceae bacterium]|jgi:hypothetical protein